MMFVNIEPATQVPCAPVTLTQRSQAALVKASRRTLEDGALGCTASP
jgi:hypothetical protein